MKALLKKSKFWLSAAAILFVVLCFPPILNLVLINSAGKGQVSTVNHLLAIGVAPSDDAFSVAASEGQTAVVCSLLAAGANPNAMNEIDETALAYAAEYGHAKVVRLMLAYGADPNWGCREMDPLTVARLGNYPDIVKMLKRAGAKD
ncbi:MAG: ankyrin repeat domain-containing protein [Janthinobacterium lividum]